MAQTQPPSSEDLQRDNQAATGNEAAQTSAQNAQLQQQMQADRTRQGQIFANQPNVNTPGYTPPAYRAPAPPPAPKPPAH